MHKLAEKIADCLKAKVEAKGIDNIEGQDLVEFGLWVDIIKDIACYDKDMRIIKAMDEEDDDDEDGEEERKYYRGRRRDSRGRFMSNRGRRGYEEPVMYYTMTPEMMKAHDPEYWRDMDKTEGRMYYSSGSGSYGRGMSGGMSGGQSGGSRNYGGESGGGRYYGGETGGNRYYEDYGNYASGQKDSREGRSGQSRKSYMETKEMHKGNSTEDKQKKMKELEKYMSELSGDITEMIGDSSPEEKSMLKAKLQALAQKVS